MVSASLKTFAATAVLIIGVAVFVAAVSTPTTICTSTQIEGEIVEQECETDESLVRWVQVGLVAGTVSWAGGLLGVYRYGKDANQVTSVVVGGLLTLFGGAVAYIFIQWYLNLAGEFEAMQQMPSTDLIFFSVLTAAGGVSMVVGLGQIWRALKSR